MMGCMNASDISAVVFDLGNVLIGWDPYLPLADRMSRDEWARFAEAADFAALNAMADGGVPLREIVGRATTTDPDHGELVGLYFERFRLSLTGPVPGVADIVTALAAGGVRLLGLTNWSAETFHFAPVSAPAISALEAIVVSGEEGVCKPSPEIFHRLTDAHGILPHQTVFIDDNADNVRAAAALGFIAILFVGAPQLRDELRGLGLPA